MTPIEYLEKLIQDFKIEYPSDFNITTSVGFNPRLTNINNMNDLPLILIEDIEYNNDASLVIMNGGKLNFNLLYLDHLTDENGYNLLEQNFLKKFNNFLLNKRNEITINNIKYNTDEENRYALTYNLSSYIEF